MFPILPYYIAQINFGMKRRKGEMRFQTQERIGAQVARQYGEEQDRGVF